MRARVRVRVRAADGGQVDCVAERDLCATQNLMAFPTIRFFKVSEHL